MRSGFNREVKGLLAAGLLAVAVVAGVSFGTGQVHAFASGIQPSNGDAPSGRQLQERPAEPKVQVNGLEEPFQGHPRGEAAAAPVTVAPRTLRPRKLPVRGRVVDLGGYGVSGAGVRTSKNRLEQPHPTTDANGHFTLEVEGGGSLLELGETSGYVALASTRAGDRKDGLVVATSTMSPLQVEVVDARTGLALPGARVELAIDEESVLGARLSEQMAREPRLHLVPHLSPSDVAGVAFFAAPPAGLELECAVSRPGYDPQKVELTSASTLRMELNPTSLATATTGRVIDAAGAPVAGAEVASGQWLVRTRRDGTFTLNGAFEEGTSTVSVYHPQHGVASDVASSADHGDIVLPSMPPANPLPLRSAQGVALSSVRVVPLAENGEPNPFAPHWQCAQADADGRLALRAQLEGEATLGRVAVAKDGSVLGRVALNAAGDSWIVQSLK
jgi:hypothetical protein